MFKILSNDTMSINGFLECGVTVRRHAPLRHRNTG